MASPAGLRAEPTVGKGAWRALVQPKARWVLHDTINKEKPLRTIVIETYDVRKVAGADVARLRWTALLGTKKDEFWGDSDELPGQVAVTDAGLYLLKAKATDAEIAERLKGKPSRSDPPKPYQGTKRNEGRYLDFRDTSGGPVTCLGQGPLPGAGDCDDICDASFCVSPTAGVVIIEGLWAPEHSIFAQRGFDK
jgi:hypothetical protein